MVQGDHKTTSTDGIQYDIDRNAGTEDTAGAFIDYHMSKGKNYFDDKDTTDSFRTELLNAGDVSYLGPVFIGVPKS